MATALRIFTCFAPQGSGHDHTYAAYLKDHGVWLGDFDQEDSIVTSLSFNQVIDKVYAETEHGVHKNTKDGPTLNAWHAQEPKKDMWCAACRAAGRETTHDVIALHIKFVHEGDEKSHAEPMRRTVWVFPCTLGDRKVFALLKCEKNFRFDSTCLWSFWKVKGGYTTDIFLTAAPKETAVEVDAAVASVSDRPQTTPKDETESTQRAKDAQTPSCGRQARRGQPSRSHPLQERLQHEGATHSQALRHGSPLDSGSGHGGMGRSQIDQSNEGDNGRDRSFDDLAGQLQLGEPDGRRRKRQASADSDDVPLAQRRRLTEARPNTPGLRSTPGVTEPLREPSNRDGGGFDEAYDVTPEVERRRRATNAAVSGQAPGITAEPTNNRFFRRFAAPTANAYLPCPVPATSTNGAPAELQSAVRDPVESIEMGGAPATARVRGPGPAAEDWVKVHFKVRDREHSSIVTVAKSTTVQEAFAAVEKKFARRLEGRSVQALSFTFENRPLNVEIDDGDAWEVALAKLLQLAANGELDAFEGLVEV